MDTFKGKKVLVTGGFGFIGSHLVKRLLQSGTEVHIITVPGTDKFRLMDGLDKIITHETDICSAPEVGFVIKTIKPDYAFHLASYGVNSAHTDYQKATRTNVLGSVNIMSALCETGCKKLVNMGTCSEYGNSETGEGSPLSPVNIYGSTKAASTIMLHQIASENEIGIITLRPFGVFGEGEEPHKIFSHVILNVLNGNDVPLTACEQFRDYCHVDNIVDAMILACERPEITNEIFNVASGELHPLKFYIDLIFEMMDTDKRPLYGAVAYRKTELWSPKADVTKIKTMLNWDVTVPLEKGIRQTVEWYKNNRNNFRV